ncbi:DUF3887 domain-containing protein [Thermococcus sp.]
MPMKRLLAILVLLLLPSHVLALTPQEAMMEALKTGNYSLVSPYLSGEMKKVFAEKTFGVIREELVNEYGPIKGYELEKTEKVDGYSVYYYRVVAERGNYTVSVTVKDGKVVGFHLVPGFNPKKALYPLLGGLLGLLLLWFYIRRFHTGELILGAVLLVPVLIIQPPLQMAPEYAGIKNGTFLILWTGLIAGLVQEPLKYYFSRDKSLGEALYIGVGFGLGEAVYVATLSVLFGGGFLGLIERTLALLFHASTTLLFAYSWRNGRGKEALLAMVLVHWLTDSIASYWHVNPSTEVIIAGYTVMLLTALVILIKLLPLVREEREETRVRW